MSSPPMSLLPKITTQTLIGILVAITGNVLISLALNLQKLAHNRLDAARLAQTKVSVPTPVIRRENTLGFFQVPTVEETEEENILLPSTASRHTFEIATTAEAEELMILSPPVHRTPTQRFYGSHTESTALGPLPPKRGNPVARLVKRIRRFRTNPKILDEETTLLLIDPPIQTTDNLPRIPEGEKGHEADYLRSKLWWSGFLLMNIGEMGNFVSYAWAPASIVAPLGTFALIANCMFAPLLIGESFRKRDLFGILVAIIGAVTVVLSSNASDTRLDPEALLSAISQPTFIVYTLIYAIGAVVLACLSQREVGKTYVFIDVGLCALFGGFTVLSTKAISTLLTMEWIEMFNRWITYPTLLVLALTGIGQVRYLNRALMRFDSKVVIPIQFVLFTLSAIIGSAILYGDFQKAKFHQVVTFFYGCAATFIGVFIIASDSGRDHGIVQDGLSVINEEAIEHDTSVITTRVGLGSMARRRGTVIPSVRRRRSSISILSLSPAQHLLLVHTPPQTELDLRYRECELGEEIPESCSPELNQRKRALSWFGDELHMSRNGRGHTTTSQSKVPLSPVEASNRTPSRDSSHF